MSEPKRDLLMLIDGHSLVYRAFYALQMERPLTNSKGELTTGVYGFTSMFLKALEMLKPTYVVGTFDSSAKTIRATDYEAYKGTRTAAPDGLSGQVRMTRELLEKIGTPVYRVDGYEADDLLATLSRQAEKADIDTVILTGDNDLLQMVGPRIKVLTSRRGISDTVLYDYDGVLEKYGGLKPEQIPDMKALRGDTSDNIPSVPGIGDKTAQKLLLEYTTVENLWENLEKVPEKQRKLLEPFHDQVVMAKRLATVDEAAPVELHLENARLGDLRRPEVLDAFHEMSFKSLIDRLPKSPTAEPAPGTTPGGAQMDLFGAALPAHGATLPQPGTTIHTTEELDALIERLRAAGTFAFNVQTVGTLPMVAELVGIGLATGEEGAYLPLGHTEGEMLDRADTLARLKPLLEDPTVAKRAHNAKFHMMVLARHGIDVQGLAFDSMIAAFLLESSQRSLALRDLAWTKLQAELPSVTALLGTGRKAITMAQLGVDDCSAYACQEARLVERLVPMLQAELDEARQIDLFTKMELPLVAVLADMEHTGIAVNQPYLVELEVELGQRLGDLEKDIYGHVGHEFNINSTQQLSRVLFEELHLETKNRRTKTKSGQQSTGVEVLEELRGTHPIVASILEHRQLQKLKSTYVDVLLTLINPESHRVHTTFNQAGAATGRLSSSDPNLMNIPVRTDEGRRVRRAFVAKEGEALLAADYSQIELRILAHMTDDEILVAAFAAGEDPHAATAAEVLGIEFDKVTSNDRRVAKMVNYGVLYGMSEFGLADRLDLPPGQAAAFLDRYAERFPSVKAYQDRAVNETRNNGYSETLAGRRRYMPEIRSPVYVVREGAKRAAINAPIQGTASDIVKKAMIDVQSYLDAELPSIKMLLQVHDELLFEGPEDDLRRAAPHLVKLMENAMTLKVPLHVDLKIGPTWEDMTKIGDTAAHEIDDEPIPMSALVG